MIAWLRSLPRQPRKPLAGVALAAIGGILLGEGGWQLAGRVALGAAPILFAGAVALFYWRPRPWLCWAVIAGGFATLHLYQCGAVPPLVLARALGEDPARLHVFTGVGRVVDEPRAGKIPAGTAEWRFTFQLESITLDRLQWPCHAPVTAFWKDASRKPVAGERLTAVGLAENVAGPRNPGEFDDAAYLRRRGIRSGLTLDGLDGLLPAQPEPGLRLESEFGSLAQRAHDWMEATLRLDLADEPEVPRLVATSLLGLRDDPGMGDLEPLFQRTGTLHYFAIDGLKLGFLGWLLLVALTSAGLTRFWARALCLLLLLGYAFTAGAGAATARAVAVAAVLLGGEWLDRPARAGNSLGAAAAVLLLCDTNQLFTLGFNLSFIVVCAILTLAPPLRNRLWAWGAPDPFLPPLLYPGWLRAREAVRRMAVDLTSISIAAWAGSLPLTFLAFHLVSPIALPANIVVFPLAAGMFGLAVFSVAGGLVWPGWSVWMNNANWLLAKALLGVLRLFDAIPGGSAHVASPERWRWPAPVAEMTVLDLGPGRAVALRTGRAEWLIDTGRAADYSRIVLPYLQAGGVDRLQALVLTTGDADHLAAAPAALADLRPRQVPLSGLPGRSPALRQVRALLAAGPATGVPLVAGKSLAPAAGVPTQVLFPPADLARTAAAGRAVVLRWVAGGWRVLLLGDSDAQAHRWLTEHVRPEDLRSDVVIAGPGADEAFLRTLAPRVVIRERSRPGVETAFPAGMPWQTIFQQQAGAVTMLIYPDRLELQEFLSGRRTVLRSSKMR